MLIFEDSAVSHIVYKKTQLRKGGGVGVGERGQFKSVQVMMIRQGAITPTVQLDKAM